MSPYRNRTCKPCIRSAAARPYDCPCRYRCNPTETNTFILTIILIDARCFSGSEIALTEIDALLGVAAGIVVDDGLQLSIICRSRRKF